MANEGLTGRVLGGKFRLIRRIGSGGMGSVYQAVHLELEKKVAVKLLHQQMAPHQEVYQRFKREAKIACKLNHPHIIEVFDFDRTEDGIPYIIMEFLQGEDLEVLLGRRRLLPLEEVVHMFEGICSAVHQAHEEGVIHRDLKPQNILLCKVGDRTDFPKVLDFGISKLKDNNSIVTQTKAYLGTPCFMAPEQARGAASEASAQSDIFAMGCILYRALGGRLAFSGDSIEAVLYKIIHEQPLGLEKLNGNVPRAVARVVHRAMAKDPALRYPSMREMWRELKEASTTTEDASAPAPKLQIIRQHPEDPQTVHSLNTANRKAPTPQETRGYGDAPQKSEGVPPLDSISEPQPPPQAPEAEAAPPQVGGVSTLSASMGEHLDKVARPRRTGWIIGAAVLLVMLGAAVIGGRSFLTKEKPPAAAETVTATSRPPKAKPEPAPAGVPAPALPARIKIELLNLPAGSKVTLDGEKVTENPFSLDQEDRRHTLKVKGPAGQTFTHEFEADKDLTLAVAFARKPKPRPRPRSKPPTPTPKPTPTPSPTKPEPPKPKPRPSVEEYGEGTMPLEL